jgi:hypothetical protein
MSDVLPVEAATDAGRSASAKNAPVEEIAAGELFLRVILVVGGIALAFVASVILALKAGWIDLAC